jgi:hypothetical protein
MSEVWPIGGGGASADRGTDGFRGRANRGVIGSQQPKGQSSRVFHVTL